MSASEEAGIIDFQLAYHSVKRGRIFRWSVGEDIRHLVKQKNRYSRENMTEQELLILNNKSGFGRFWSNYAKPVYNFVTRKMGHRQDKIDLAASKQVCLRRQIRIIYRTGVTYV